MAVMQLHPIMYVPDQYAERAFYELLGFRRHYEGDEFPGFLALRHGDAIIGLQQASAENPAFREGLRWQFEVQHTNELDELITVCQAHQLEYEMGVERGGDRFRTRLLLVRSPAGVRVCFEGPNELAALE
jgi:catechol 2,3-dioxygenase-like lactoylglutathione lyase family enzyme